MDRRVALAFARFDAAELKFCRYLNRSSRSLRSSANSSAPRVGSATAGSGTPRSSRCRSSTASKGCSLPLHLAATGAVGVRSYKLIKNRAVRERPYITHSAIECASAPLDRYSFPSGHTLHAVCFTFMLDGYFPEWTGALVALASADRAVARDPRPPLPDRRRGRCDARWLTRLRQRAARAAVVRMTVMIKQASSLALRATRWWSAPARFTAETLRCCAPRRCRARACAG